MTEDDRTAIGASLALDAGLPEVMGLLEPELSALSATLTARGLMLQELIQLGQALNAFMVNAAPITELSETADGADALTEHELPDVVGPTRAYHSYRPTPRGTHGLPTRLATTPLSSARMTVAEATTPSIRHLPQQSATLAQQTQIPTAKTAINHVSRAITASKEQSRATEASKEQSPIEPSLSLKGLIPSAPIVRCATDIAEPLWAVRRLSPSAGPHVIDVGTGARPRNDTEQIVAQTIAPIGSFVAGTEPRSVQPVGALDTASLTTPAPFNKVADAAAEPGQVEGPLSYRLRRGSATGDQTGTGSEPRQGTIVLDGAQLGRWMMDQLEWRASRPGAMTTGIDPRISPTFPGAPTGG